MATKKKSKSPFTSAKRVKQYLKLVVSGDTDAGKTHFGLTAPSPGIIDMEGNASLFVGREFTTTIDGKEETRPFDFEIMETRSFRDTSKAVDFLLANPDCGLETLVVDNASLLWEACQEGYISKVERKAREGGGGREDAELQFGDWRILKRPWKDLMRKLFNLPMHVIFLCRISEEYKVVNGVPTLTGKKLDTEKRTKYFGTVHLHLEVSDDGKRTGFIMRDKWGIYNYGDIIDNPSFWTFESLLSHAPESQGDAPQQESDDDVAEKDGESFDTESSDQKERVKVIAMITKAGKVMFNDFAARGREAYNLKIEESQGNGTLKELPLGTLNNLLSDLRILHTELKDTAPTPHNNGPVGSSLPTKEELETETEEEEADLPFTN